MKIHETLKQNTPEWLAVRQLKLTASNAQAIAAAGAGLTTLVEELVADYFSNAEKEPLDNEHIQRGNELEPIARSLYELEYDCEVKEVGFIELNEYVGVSPDGLVGDHGLIEIKCPADKGYINQLVTKKIPSKYLWQMQMQMLVSEREWCDYVCYNPNFKKDMLVIRVYADKDKQDKLQAGFEKGIKLIKKYIKEMEK